MFVEFYDFLFFVGFMVFCGECVEFSRTRCGVSSVRRAVRRAFPWAFPWAHMLVPSSSGRTGHDRFAPPVRLGVVDEP